MWSLLEAAFRGTLRSVMPDIKSFSFVAATNRFSLTSSIHLVECGTGAELTTPLLQGSVFITERSDGGGFVNLTLLTLRGEESSILLLMLDGVSNCQQVSSFWVGSSAPLLEGGARPE